MENTTALQNNDCGQAVVVSAERNGTPRLVMSDVAGLPLSEAEAELTVELDRLQELSGADPLDALDQILGVMQGINLELLKCQAPGLVERAHLDAAEFTTSAKLPDARRGDEQALVKMLRLQESVAKLGAARVRVHDELQRRRH